MLFQDYNIFIITRKEVIGASSGTRTPQHFDYKSNALPIGAIEAYGVNSRIRTLQPSSYIISEQMDVLPIELYSPYYISDLSLRLPLVHKSLLIIEFFITSIKCR